MNRQRGGEVEEQTDEAAIEAPEGFWLGFWFYLNPPNKPAFEYLIIIRQISEETLNRYVDYQKEA